MALDNSELKAGLMHHYSMRSLALLMLGLACPLLQAATVNVRVADPTGVGIPKILVIVNSLEGKGEVWRGLTDDKGLVPSLDLSAGLYELIATSPYGPWSTKVKDFVVTTTAVELELRPGFAITGALPAATSKLSVQVVGRDGVAVSGATLMARDREAKYAFFWAETDHQGRALITLPLDGAEITTIYGGQVVTQELNIDSDLSRCSRRCWDNDTKERKRTLPKLTVRLP